VQASHDLFLALLTAHSQADSVASPSHSTSSTPPNETQGAPAPALVLSPTGHSWGERCHTHCRRCPACVRRGQGGAVGGLCSPGLGMGAGRKGCTPSRNAGGRLCPVDTARALQVSGATHAWWQAPSGSRAQPAHCWKRRAALTTLRILCAFACPGKWDITGRACWSVDTLPGSPRGDSLAALLGRGLAAICRSLAAGSQAVRVCVDLLSERAGQLLQEASGAGSQGPGTRSSLQGCPRSLSRWGRLCTPFCGRAEAAAAPASPPCSRG